MKDEDDESNINDVRHNFEVLSVVQSTSTRSAGLRMKENMTTKQNNNNKSIASNNRHLEVAMETIMESSINLLKKKKTDKQR